ncbi:MAG: GTPase [Candidatus Woesearchaeota archaeon]
MSFWNIVNKVIQDSDIVLIVLDSRLMSKTRNKELEDKVQRQKKPHIYVLTKCDLIEQEEADRLKKQVYPSVFVSSKSYHGLKLLREKIIILGKQNYKEKKKYTVGIVGYPNVGKSSLINALNGRSSAGVSSVSGYTKGVQKVKIDNKLMFLDTPGVIPYEEKNPEKHSITGSIDPSKTKDPDLAVYKLIEEFPGMLESHYEIEEDENEDIIEQIALKKGVLLSKGKPDTDRMSRKILKDFLEGKINKKL